MVKKRFAYFLAVATLAACNAASPAPAGWQPVPGEQNAWRHGTGPTLQTYEYRRTDFSGALPDLASQVTVDALIQHPGARLRSSNPLGPCPGAAGLATFSLSGGRVLQEGFAVHDGQAIRTVYMRPAGQRADSNVLTAMQNVLC
jgi:hypothetical protein